jgi:hypothetical protein
VDNAVGERIRVCVIGMGPIGNLHADIYRTTDFAERQNSPSLWESATAFLNERRKQARGSEFLPLSTLVI